MSASTQTIAVPQAGTRQYPLPPVLDDGAEDLPHQLLKLSGEFLHGGDQDLIDADKCDRVAAEVAATLQSTRVGIVVGGGNIWRGDRDRHPNMSEEESHYNGMLATYMNARSLGAAFHGIGIPYRVVTLIDMPRICENFNPERAMHHLHKGRVVIFACGTGNPHCTTDFAGALHGTMIGATVVHKGSHGATNGIFDQDPRQHPNAKHISRISYQEALVRGLEVMDPEAFSLCRKHNTPIHVFSVEKPGSITRALQGEIIGSWVS